jgi:hypothetical protein
LPDGVTATPTRATAQKGPGDSDTNPRQFWVDVSAAAPFKSLQLTLNYFGCTEDLCLALTHEYTVEMKAEEDGSRTYGMNKGTKNGKMVGGKQGAGSRTGTQSQPGGGSRMTQMDANNDGAVSFEEMCAQVKKQRPDDFSADRIRRRFDLMDINKDGALSASELETMQTRQR